MSRVSIGTMAGMRDEVDRLVEAWRRERADLDLAPMEVLSRVSRLGHHLDGARRRAFSEHGVESWEFDVLAALRRAGPPYQLSPGRLLKETLVTSGTMTNRVDRLAARGLVERLADPHGRRGGLVRLTPAGRKPRDGGRATRTPGAACGSGGPRPGAAPWTAPWRVCWPGSGTSSPRSTARSSDGW